MIAAVRIRVEEVRRAAARHELHGIVSVERRGKIGGDAAANDADESGIVAAPVIGVGPRGERALQAIEKGAGSQRPRPSCGSVPV